MDDANHHLTDQPTNGKFATPMPRVMIGVSTLIVTFLLGSVSLVFVPFVLAPGILLVWHTDEGYWYERIGDSFASLKERRSKRGGWVHTTRLEDCAQLDRSGVFGTSHDPFPLQLDILQADVGGALGVIHDPTEGTDTCVIEMAGWSRAVNADPDQLFILNSHVMQYVSELLRSGLISTVSYYFVVRPHDMTQPAHYLAKNVHEDFLSPTNEVEQSQMDNVTDAADLIGLNASRVEVGIATTAVRHVEWQTGRRWNGRRRQFDPSRVTQQQLAKAPLIQAARQLLVGLRAARVEGVGLMKPLDLVSYLRCLHDVSPEIQRFYRELAEDKRRDEAGLVADLSDTFTMRRGPWPTEVQLRHTELLTDSTFTRFFFVSGFNSAEVAPDFMHRLLSIGRIWYTLAFVASPTSSKKAQWVNREKRSFHRTRTANDPDRLPDHKRQEDAQKAEIESMALHRSGYLAIDFGVYLSVSATTLEELEAATDVISEHCLQMGASLTPVLREVRQLSALYAPLGKATEPKGK